MTSQHLQRDNEPVVIRPWWSKPSVAWACLGMACLGIIAALIEVGTNGRLLYEVQWYGLNGLSTLWVTVGLIITFIGRRYHPKRTVSSVLQGSLGIVVFLMANFLLIARPPVPYCGCPLCNAGYRESAATATLRYGIFPAQIFFTGRVYQDRDQDGVGEYGFLAELSGDLATTGTTTNQLTLLTGPLANAGPLDLPRVSTNYNFICYIPRSTGALATVQDPPPSSPIDIDIAEAYFFVVAVPVRYGDSGRRVFILDNTGQVYSALSLEDTAAFFAGPLEERPLSYPRTIRAGLQAAFNTPSDWTSGLDYERFSMLSR